MYSFPTLVWFAPRGVAMMAFLEFQIVVQICNELYSFQYVYR